jgi:hypothetical protein
MPSHFGRRTTRDAQCLLQLHRVRSDQQCSNFLVFRPGQFMRAAGVSAALSCLSNTQVYWGSRPAMWGAPFAPLRRLWLDRGANPRRMGAFCCEFGGALRILRCILRGRMQAVCGSPVRDVHGGSSQLVVPFPCPATYQPDGQAPGKQQFASACGRALCSSRLVSRLKLSCCLVCCGEAAIARLLISSVLESDLAPDDARTLHTAPHRSPHNTTRYMP